MLAEAEKYECKLDDNIIAAVNAFCARLISERNLRKQRDLYIEGISESDSGQVNKL
jgi:hypothetical protein